VTRRTGVLGAALLAARTRVEAARVDVRGAKRRAGVRHVGHRCENELAVLAGLREDGLGLQSGAHGDSGAALRIQEHTRHRTWDAGSS